MKNILFLFLLFLSSCASEPVFADQPIFFQSGITTPSISAGAIKITGGATNHYVFTSDALGNGTWQPGGGSPAWGSITGTLSSQTDLDTALGLKSPIASPTFTGTVTTPALKIPTGASNGYVWTSDSLGNGTWAAAGGGGANTDLSNLTPTSINQDLLFNSDATFSVGGSGHGALFMYSEQFRVTNGGSVYDAINGSKIDFSGPQISIQPSNGKTEFLGAIRSGTNFPFRVDVNGHLFISEPGLAALDMGVQLDYTGITTGEDGNGNSLSYQVVSGDNPSDPAGVTGSLIFSTGNLTGGSRTGATGNYTITTGNNQGSGATGSISIHPGDASPLSANSSPGTMEIDGGNVTAGNGNSTGLTLRSGNSYNGSPGDFFMTPGCDRTGVTCGNFWIGSGGPTGSANFVIPVAFLSTGTVYTIAAGGVIQFSDVSGSEAASFVRIQAASAVSTDPTTPIANGFQDGQVLDILNTGANAITIKGVRAGSDRVLIQKDMTHCIYSSNSGYWSCT